MTRAGHVIYLHGFASSPASSKARRFGRELAALGVPFECPDLNEPEFRTVTVTRMVEQTRALIARAQAGPIALVGSSLGALVALFTAGEPLDLGSGLSERGLKARAGRRVEVDRLILLAPAVDRIRQLAGYSVDEWRRRGSIPFFHYALERQEEVAFALYEDAERHDASTVALTVPVLVFHGRHDESVDPAAVERWAAGRSNVDLRMLDDAHQLSSSIDYIWEESRKFLGV
jgi:pimeloyl-ACP methyl ester carboxylesterase